MTVENISWSISTKECCQPCWGWTRDLLIASRMGHPTEPLRPASLWEEVGAKIQWLKHFPPKLRSPCRHSSERYFITFNIGIKHDFSCINIRQVPWEVLKTEAEGRGFQHLPRDLANVNALKNYVWSLLLHKKWKHLLHFQLFLALYYVKMLLSIFEGHGFQHLPRDLANVNALKNHVWSLLLHKKWKYLLHFQLFLELFCFAFLQMSRERNFHRLC